MFCYFPRPAPNLQRTISAAVVHRLLAPSRRGQPTPFDMTTAIRGMLNWKVVRLNSLAAVSLKRVHPKFRLNFKTFLWMFGEQGDASQQCQTETIAASPKPKSSRVVTTTEGFRSLLYSEKCVLKPFASRLIHFSEAEWILLTGV